MSCSSFKTTSPKEVLYETTGRVGDIPFQKLVLVFLRKYILFSILICLFPFVVYENPFDHSVFLFSLLLFEIFLVFYIVRADTRFIYRLLSGTRMENCIFHTCFCTDGIYYDISHKTEEHYVPYRDIIMILKGKSLYTLVGRNRVSGEVTFIPVCTDSFDIQTLTAWIHLIKRRKRNG